MKDWFYCIYLFSVSKNGVSAKEIERHLGVTYKCAWRIANRIRSLLVDDTISLQGIVEIDETYYGGKEKNKHKDKKTPQSQGRSTKSKAPILGAVERKGSVKAQVVSDVKTSTVQSFAKKHIALETTLNTDEYKGYKNISKYGFKHQVVNHSAKEYVKGQSYTNTIEGFWSQLKRSINGTYHMVSRKHLQQYVDEFAFRYNLRYATQHDFFAILPKAGLPFQAS